MRGYWLAEEMTKHGIRCSLHPRNSKLGLALRILHIAFSDVVIFQKVYSRYHLWLAKFAVGLGKSVYLDMDDAPSRTGNPKTIAVFEEMARLADGVFAGCVPLYDYVHRVGGRAHLVLSGVRLENYEIADVESSSRCTCIGWIGNGAHYERDLIQILRGPLERLALDYPLRLKLVGTAGCGELRTVLGDIPSLGIEFIDELDWSDPGEVSRHLCEMDVGVYPLLATEFNQYKLWVQGPGVHGNRSTGGGQRKPGEPPHYILGRKWLSGQ